LTTTYTKEEPALDNYFINKSLYQRRKSFIHCIVLGSVRDDALSQQQREE
jgi:hypothetical protein